MDSPSLRGLRVEDIRQLANHLRADVSTWKRRRGSLHTVQLSLDFAGLLSACTRQGCGGFSASPSRLLLHTCLAPPIKEGKTHMKGS